MFAPRNKYLWWRFKPENIDWVGAGFDAAGIVVGAFTLGYGGNAAKAAKLIRASRMIEAGDILTGGAFMQTSYTYTGKPPSGWEMAGLATDVGGVLFESPGAGIVFCVTGLACNLGNAGLFDFGP